MAQCPLNMLLTGAIKPPTQNYHYPAKECKRRFRTNQTKLRGLIESQLQQFKSAFVLTSLFIKSSIVMAS